MSSKEKPYIGVTGITTLNEASQIARLFEELRLNDSDSRHRGMAGYLVSLKTLSDASYHPKYPRVNQLPDLLRITAPYSLNSIHYHTHEPQTLYHQLNGLMEDLASRGVRPEVLQFNLAWPPVDDIHRLRSDYPDLKVVLQIDPTIVDDNPTQAGNKLKVYHTAIEYVLLDSSRGHGQELIPPRLVDTCRIVRDILPDTTFIFAGGLTNTNVALKVKEIRMLTGQEDFGVDAEDKLRAHNRSASRLKLNKVIKYVQEARRALLDIA